MEYKPYTYLIGWSKLDKYYYGVRYAKNYATLYPSGCHPDDLWVTYFTSSSYVKSYIEEHGQPDVIKIRKTFDNANDAIAWETKFLNRAKALSNPRLLNMNVGEAFVMTSKIAKESAKKRPPPTKETKDKLRKANTGKKRSSVTKEKLSLIAKNRIYSEETREKMRKAHTGRKHTEESKKKIAEANSRRIVSQETREKMSKFQNSLFIKCPHCGKEGKGAAMKRWHLDNCKYFFK